MGDGLQRGLDAVEGQLRSQRATGDRRSPAAIVLLSDGKNTAGQTSPLDAARRARELRVPIYAVALGTPEGTITLTDPGGFEQTIPVPPDPGALKLLAAQQVALRRTAAGSSIRLRDAGHPYA